MSPDDSLPGATHGNGILVFASLCSPEVVPWEERRLEDAGLELGILFVFVRRDVLFLDGCNLRRMKRPVIELATPGDTFRSEGFAIRETPSLPIGIVLQVAVCLATSNVILGRIRRPDSAARGLRLVISVG